MDTDWTFPQRIINKERNMDQTLTDRNWRDEEIKGLEKKINNIEALCESFARLVMTRTSAEVAVYFTTLPKEQRAPICDEMIAEIKRVRDLP